MQQHDREWKTLATAPPLLSPAANFQVFLLISVVLIFRFFQPFNPYLNNVCIRNSGIAWNNKRPLKIFWYQDLRFFVFEMCSNRYFSTFSSKNENGVKNRSQREHINPPTLSITSLKPLRLFCRTLY